MPPRGRRRAYADVSTLEKELQELKQKQSELRQQLRRMRNSATEIRKLEEKLRSQLGGAKWTVGLIKQLQPDWDDVSFYQKAPAKQPTPRGRRKRAPAEA
jgi:chromosome segregation ATPase